MSRADAGIPRLTARDAEMLAYLEDMRAVWETDVAAMLGYLAGRDRAVSPTSVRTAIRRWSKLGVARAEKVFAHEPRIVWLTSAGAGMAGAEQWVEPSKGVLRHTAEVARVRGWLSHRGLAGQPIIEWVSERQWRQEHRNAIKNGAHVPDGIAVTADGTRYAIEVELTSKGAKKTLGTAVQLTQEHAQVLYLVPAGTQTARTVRSALEQAAQDRGVGQGQLRVLELPERGEGDG